MKRMIFALTFFILSFFFLFNLTYGADVGATYFRQMNGSENFGPSDGIKITGKPEALPIYAWCSWEHSRFSLVGQPVGYIDLIGVGMGVKKTIVSGISLFLDGGWYYPQWYANGKLVYPVSGDIGDRTYLYLNEKYGDTLGVTIHEAYRTSISGNFGGSFGAEWDYQITKSFLVSTSIAYRILSLPVWVEGVNTGNVGNWCRYEDMSLSGVAINAGVVWSF